MSTVRIHTDDPLYHSELWYCDLCDKRTPVELDAEWVAAGKPVNFSTSAVAHCAVCGNTLMEPTEYDCPNCGWSGDIGDYLVPDKHNPNKLKESGPLIHVSNTHIENVGEYTARMWTEEWKCPMCGTEFEYENSDT
jgi:predicted RNA-binding Zn-ribbon protein involved in translation (DUF1610 family)